MCAFCENLKEVYFSGTPEEWKEILEMENEAIEEMLSFVGKGLLSGVIRIDGLVRKNSGATIGGEVTKIPAYLFRSAHDDSYNPKNNYLYSNYL